MIIKDKVKLIGQDQGIYTVKKGDAEYRMIPKDKRMKFTLAELWMDIQDGIMRPYITIQAEISNGELICHNAYKTSLINRLISKV